MFVVSGLAKSYARLNPIELMASAGTKVASSKGLFSGHLSIILNDDGSRELDGLSGTQVRCSRNTIAELKLDRLRLPFLTSSGRFNTSRRGHRSSEDCGTSQIRSARGERSIVEMSFSFHTMPLHKALTSILHLDVSKAVFRTLCETRFFDHARLGKSIVLTVSSALFEVISGR